MVSPQDRDGRTQARVYIGEAAEPVLVVTGLEHGATSGAIGVSGPMDGSAYFSNFTYEERDDLDFPAPPYIDSPPGLLAEWELSRVFTLSDVEFERYPDDGMLAGMEWQSVQCDHTGLINVAWRHPRSGREPDVVFARTEIEASQNETRKILFGYSDAISIFINGDIVFTGNSAYRQRDPSFLGIIGFNDAVHLPLKQGKNEIFIALAEAFGGWGFMFQDGNAVYLHGDAGAAWETEREFATPESAVYDAERNVIYVSNFDAYRTVSPQYISRLSPAGAVTDLRWVDGIVNPTGMVLKDKRLYVVERSAVVEIDADSGEIVERRAVPQPGFLNDIAVDRSGAIYVSDSRRSVILKYAGGEWEDWVSGGGIGMPNGMCIQDGTLVIGNNADHTIKRIDLAMRDITTIARFESGIIDGITGDRNGHLLFSHWEGRLYRMTTNGDIEKLIDTTVLEYNIADFGYNEADGTVFIPTFADNRVTAYRIR